MSSTLISIWGPRMEKALRFHFRLHGVESPDAGDVGCLAAIGVIEIDRRNLGFRSTSFLGMASLLVPAILDPNHRLHGEITAAVRACKALGATAPAAGAGAAAAKPRGSLAATVAAAKLPRLGQGARAYARMAETKAVPKRTTATARKRPPK
jgi:hypothetical protein